MDAEEKLVWLGIKTNAAKVNKLAADVAQLSETVGDWGSFQDLVTDDVTSYAELNTELVDTYGWSQEDADAFISRLENEFNSFSDFQTSVDGFESYEDLQSLFDSASTFAGDAETETGQPAAGIRIHESSGTSYAGVSLPAGTTEVFGTRIEFSQQEPVRGTREAVTYGSISTDDADNVANVFASITFSVDVTNPNNFSTTASIPLTEDGDVVKSKEVRFNASETKTVSFTVTKQDYICADYAIGKSDSVLACWVPSGLII